MEKDHDLLVSLFKDLGLPEPESLADEELSDGEPILAYHLFLRRCWERIVPEGDYAWIGEEIERSEKNATAPFASIGQSLKSLKARGATDEELESLVRGMQAQFLSEVCYLLDNPCTEEEEAEELSWGFFETDEDEPVTQIVGLNQSVLAMDPTGREMRPKGS